MAPDMSLGSNSSLALASLSFVCTKVSACVRIGQASSLNACCNDAGGSSTGKAAIADRLSSNWFVEPTPMVESNGSSSSSVTPRNAARETSVGRAMVTCVSTVHAGIGERIWATRPNVPAPVELISTSPTCSSRSAFTSLDCLRAGAKPIKPPRMHFWLMTSPVAVSSYLGVMPRFRKAVSSPTVLRFHPCGIPDAIFVVSCSGNRRFTNHSRYSSLADSSSNAMRRQLISMRSS